MSSWPSSIRISSPIPLNHELRPPGSKSLTNRALLLAAMAEGESLLVGGLDAEDSELMREALHRLGISVEEKQGANGEPNWRVAGLGSLFGHQLSGDAPLQVGTAGTVARFLSAALASSGTKKTVPSIAVDGSPRMRERPMGSLLSSLRELGAVIDCDTSNEALPFSVTPKLLRGGTLEMNRPVSSQFVSALVIAALRAESELSIVLREGTPARPYVDMTLECVRDFGGKATWKDEQTILIEPGALKARRYSVEPDASAASYWLGWNAIHGGKVKILGLGTGSQQGDAGFAKVLGRFGCLVEQGDDWTTLEGGHPLKGCKLDLTDMPDMTLTAAVVALFAEGPTEISGVEILRHHESDRLNAGATELRKLGAHVEEREDGLKIEPPIDGPKTGVSIDTYLDHRMAMAFSMVGDVVIRDPSCVAKTYPGYFQELKKAGVGVLELHE